MDEEFTKSPIYISTHWYTPIIVFGFCGTEFSIKKKAQKNSFEAGECGATKFMEESRENKKGA